MKKFLILVIILIIASGAVLFFKTDLLASYRNFSAVLPQIERGVNDLAKEAEKQIFTPPPLRAEKEAQEAFLTKEGVISWTNSQRAKYGLPALKESLILDVSAGAKVSDMFQNQYFAHESPEGLGVGDLAESAGYKFIIIGENLALGNFENDESLVQAWMDSPGHRANILNEKYQEIGVSVEKGIYEGKPTWLAVQHFSMPLSACSEPNTALKTLIGYNQKQIDELKNKLEELRSQLESLRPRDREIYNQKVAEYNSLVAQYNELVNDTKSLVSNYNAQVNLFNDCAASATH